MYFSTNYDSPLGELLIASDGQALVGVWFHDQKHFKSTLTGKIIKKDNLAIFTEVRQWLDDYFNALNPEVTFRLNPQGTDFRKRVWKALSEIPYGETVTYGEIASGISPTMSAQAVGGAVGHNPICIIIPCHRVIGKNGKLTGYAGGLERKMELLKLEGVAVD